MLPYNLKAPDDSGTVAGIEPPPCAITHRRCPDLRVAVTMGPVNPQTHRPKDLFIPFMLQGPGDLALQSGGEARTSRKS